MLLSDEELEELFDHFEQSAFRLETLDYYGVERDMQELRLYLAGEPHRPAVPEDVAAWNNQIIAWVAEGKRYYRVHVVQSPLNDYLRFECEWGYVYTQRTGEEIFILDTAERPRPEELPDEDFWLLDDDKVIRMHYDEEGRFVGGELLPGSEAPRYCRYRDMAVAAAVPFEEYWAAHPEYLRENWLKSGR
ncbi:MAG: DUF6879 family protein [Egibacteraceae bacterium]